MLNHLKFFSLLFVVTAGIFAQTASKIKLPEPKKTGGMPLMEALSARQSARDFNAELSLQEQSDLLWSMFGINRENGKRTAPSARDFQEIELFAVRKDGVYKYNAKENTLELVKSGDYRKIAGVQAFAKNAPLNILLIADLSKMSKDAEQNALAAHADAGFISQNAYLYCASNNFQCRVRMMIDKDDIIKTLGLNANMLPVFGITIGK